MIYEASAYLCCICLGSQQPVWKS